MPKYQGLNNLKRGITRKLTLSEASRGYLFISKDRAFREIVGDQLIVNINGKPYSKRLDSHGRVFIGKSTTDYLSSNEVKVIFDPIKKIVQIELSRIGR